MSKWIDADKLIMALRLEYPMMPMFKDSRKEWELKTEGYRKAEEIIKEAPSELPYDYCEDATECYKALEVLPSIDIVRCKECENFIPMTHGCKRSPSVEPWWEDDYCSYGERREDE